MSKNVKDARHNVPEPEVFAFKCFFCPTNGPKLPNSSFTVLKDKEKQHILTFKELETTNI